jgi:pilus assembly protein CpaC
MSDRAKRTRIRPRRSRGSRPIGRLRLPAGAHLLAAAGLLLGFASPGHGQEASGTVPSGGDLVAEPLPIQDRSVITVARGNSQVIIHPSNLERVMVSDPGIADVITVTAREVVVNGLRPGTTTLLLWDALGARHAHTVRVTVDARTVQEEFRRIFPEETFLVAAVGNTLILSGETRNAQAAERAVSLAATLEREAEILDYIVVPDRGQVLLQVRIAEVGRTGLQALGAHVTRIDPFGLRTDDEGMVSPGGVVSPGGSFLGFDGPDRTFSDAVNFYLFHRRANVNVFIQALKTEGHFKSLAEPNLLTLPNETASFLAGGEFPYPVVQTGAQASTTIQFQEFGIRLHFTPTITSAGAIRMEVEPEVSSLDFAGGLQIGGFSVPTILTRRAHTVVEVQEGQTFAIAGLMDNQLSESVQKIPFLGDIPILGRFFRSNSRRQERTELLVLVTPHLVGQDMEVPEVPTGEPGTWEWFRHMQLPPDTAAGAPEGGLP